MASFFFLEDSTTAQTLAAGEFGFIGDEGSLEVTGDAITANGGALVTVHGRLFGTESAIVAQNGAFALVVGETGRINGRDADTVDIDGVGEAFVSNAGRIRSGDDALDLRGTGPIVILNSGSLIGNSDGVVTESVGSTVRLVNTGTISGEAAGGIDHLAGDSFLVNRGAIVGVSYGFDAADPVDDGAVGADQVRNFGSIEGGVFLYGLADTVLNRGEIDRVELGGGDDVYVGRGSGSAGSVDGGGGFDLLLSSRADDTFIGGASGDIFAYARGGGDDRIEDFGGADRIDVSDFGFSGLSELRPLIEDTADGALIDLPGTGSLLLVGVDKADLRPNDFLFELLVT